MCVGGGGGGGFSLSKPIHVMVIVLGVIFKLIFGTSYQEWWIYMYQYSFEIFSRIWCTGCYNYRNRNFYFKHLIPRIDQILYLEHVTIVQYGYPSIFVSDHI